VVSEAQAVAQMDNLINGLVPHGYFCRLKAEYALIPGWPRVR
jgi:hypothetical protein